MKETFCVLNVYVSLFFFFLVAIIEQLFHMHITIFYSYCPMWLDLEWVILHYEAIKQDGLSCYRKTINIIVVVWWPEMKQC